MNTQDYLERIRYQGPLTPDLETLQALHEAHMLAVPFENLSIHYGQPIVLNEEVLYNKIVSRRRGGFCYELNGLFAWLLRELGFRVTLLSAGVANQKQDGGYNPDFDHLTLRVHDLAGSDWLVDVGFGDSFRLPLRLELEVEQDGADGHTYQLIEEGDYWILRQRDGAGFEPQYRFTLQPRALSDFNARCHYHQTSPDSGFTKKRVCSLALPDGRLTLSDLLLITTLQGRREERSLSNEQEYVATLAKLFDITI
ncbi:arylamine N-acetyltransferase family protein [Ktedonospora formicarum]|uniref:Acetyltransferase n=1 Tax=Ktedonospora formicarum TaxID=2778364 RepID=A0A8J3I5W0_9CHLR|nr:arylamine N-acetyltransferase [Ktedonospora formicarum]GHO47971.1 acetyltransferase [Ktedonospora formicarum]